MAIFIVIPVYNRKSVTRDCLLSLKRQSSRDFKIIVIDDGSTDGTSQMISYEFPEVILLKGDGELWWTGAVNKGIRYVLENCYSSDYVLMLNDDLIVPIDYIESIERLATIFPDTLVGSVILDIRDQDTILSGGSRINWITAKRWILDTEKKRSLFPTGYYNDVSTLTGRGVLIPTKVFRDIGLYNERHYKHYGDVEFPKRAAKAGYKLIVSYDAIVYSHPLRELSDDSYRLLDIGKYFFDIRSNTNLLLRFWLAYDTSPNILRGTIYLLFDLARVVFHFLRRVRL
jgi:GT2 family glycosyltransferase